MEKVDLEVKRAKSRGGNSMDKKRIKAANPNSHLNHLFKNEMEMMTQGVKT